MGMYSRFGKKEDPLKKYIGRLAKLSDYELKLMGYGCDGLPAVGRSCNEFEVVGYSHTDLADEPLLIVDASQSGGWLELELEPFDFVSKKCKYYWYVDINDLID